MMLEQGDLIELVEGTMLLSIKEVMTFESSIPERDIEVVGRVSKEMPTALYLSKDIHSGYHQVLYNAQVVFIRNKDCPNEKVCIE